MSRHPTPIYIFYAVFLRDSYSVQTFCKHFGFEQGTLISNSKKVPDIKTYDVHCKKYEKNLESCKNYL